MTKDKYDHNMICPTILHTFLNSFLTNYNGQPSFKL